MSRADCDVHVHHLGDGNCTCIPPHQVRLIIEKRELSERLSKLKSFMGQQVYRDLPMDERRLLGVQCSAMETYLQVLVIRMKDIQI